MSNEMPKLPLLVNNQILMSPGVWNGTSYSSEEIKKAFLTTDWTSENVLSLFLDHPENPNNAATAWAGRVVQARMMGDEVVGDLEIFDLSTAIKLKMGGAKFGVSPRVVSPEVQDGGEFKNFLFDNFSIVSKPAIDTAYIQLAKVDQDKHSKQLFKTDGEPNYIELSNSTQLKGGIKEMSETTEEVKEDTEEVKPEESESQEEEAPVEEATEEAAPEVPAEVVEEAEAPEEAKELSFKDLSAEELDKVTLKAQKAKDLKTKSIREMSAQAIAPVSEEMKVLKEQIKELSEKLNNKPMPKTVKGSGGTVSATENLVGVPYSEGVKEMAAYLKENYS